MKKLLALLLLKISNSTMSKILPEAEEAAEEVSEEGVAIKEKTKVEVVELIITTKAVEDLIITTKAVEDLIITTKAVEELTLNNNEEVEVAIEITKISIKVTLTLNVRLLSRMVTKISLMLKRSPVKTLPELRIGSLG